MQPEKHKCIKCNQLAIWYYVPWSKKKIELEAYYCDDCISRGCSCNVISFNPNPDDPASYEQYKDEQERLLPCCEYDWDGDGFSLNRFCGEDNIWSLDDK